MDKYIDVLCMERISINIQRAGAYLERDHRGEAGQILSRRPFAQFSY